MQRTHFIRGLAIVALTMAACGSDNAATSPTTVAGASTTTSSTASTTTTPASENDEPGTEMHATFASANPTIGAPICDSQQHCMIPLTLAATLSGDLTGSSLAYGASALVGSDFAGSDTLIFTGTITGCGTGTIVTVGTGVGSMTGATTSEWKIVEGFGSGDLARVRGTGTTMVTPNGDGTLGATLTAHIACD